VSGYFTGAPVALAGGASVPAFDLITGWGSLNDPGARTTTGTAHDGSGGLTFVMAGDVVQYDGWQETAPDFDVLLTDLYPDWSDETDRFEWCMNIGAMPLSTAKYGLATWFRDANSAGRGTANGTGLLIYPNSTTVVNAAQAGPTGAAVTAAANGSNTNVPSQVYGSVTFDSAGVPRVTGRVQRTSDQGEIVLAGTAPAALGAAANRRFCCAVVHVSVTTGTPTLAASVYSRRVRTTGPFA